MREYLPTLIMMAGVAHMGVLLGAALVPFRLDWKKELGSLPRLHRQMYVVYGGYVVLSIFAFGLMSLLFSAELAGGEPFARYVCGYIAIFWGVRLCLQAVFDVKPYLTAWWLKCSYHGLTICFAYFTVVFAWAALGR